MKIVLILMALHGSTCLKFPDLTPQEYQITLLDVTGVNESIFYYNSDDSDTIVNFLLKNIFSYQSVLLVSGENITLKGVMNQHPNIIILLESMNTEDFETETFKTLLSSYWTLLHLVITSRSNNYACENGTLNKNAFAETKNYLNELWQLFSIVRVSVSFPYTCPGQYFIYHGKELSETNVYNRSVRGIKPKNTEEYRTALYLSGVPQILAQDYPLRVNIFYRFPTSITNCDSVNLYTNIDFLLGNKYCGLDGLIMHDYVTHYKFNVLAATDDTCDKYGYTDKNSQVTGSLGCIVRQKIDISFNSRFIWQYTIEKYNYLNFISQDSLCVVMKRSGKIPLWHYAGNFFDPLIWIALLSSLFLMGTVTWLFAKLSAKFSNVRPFKLHTYLFNTIYSTLFGVLLQNDGKFLILKGASLLCSVILVAVYQGHYSYQFTTRSHYHEIKTLEEFYKSQYTLSTSKSIMELLKPSMDLSNPDQVAFLKRAQMRNSTSMDYIFKHLDIATLARQQDAKIEVLQNYTDKYGLPQIFVLDECLHTYYLSYITRNGFLFVEESAKFMMRMIEAGLPMKYYMWTRNTFNLADHWPGTGPTPRPFKRMNIKKLRIAFGILLIGYVVSGLIFIVESWKGRKSGDKNC